MTTPTKPTQAAMRAADKLLPWIDDAIMEHYVVTEDTLASLIDQETGLPELIEAATNLADEAACIHQTAPPDYAWSECICAEEEGHAQDCPVNAVRAALQKAACQ